MKNELLIRYQVRMADPAGHRFAIRLTIPEPDPAGQSVRLPAWIPGSYLIRDFARQIETLQAGTSHGPVATHKTDSHTWHCAPCKGPLDIEYQVYAWDLSVRGAHFDESHAFFNGTSLFLAVLGQEHKPCLLELCPPQHARDWQVYTSLPSAMGHPDAAPLRGFGSYLAADYDALIDHPVEIGTPQCISFEAHGAVHDLVFTGHAPRLDLERIAHDVQKICAAQIELFEPETLRAPFLDSAGRYVFMTMITEDGYGGLEHRSSTALMIRRQDLPFKGCEAPASYTSFLGLVSHEYFHTWHVKRIKPAAFAPYRLEQPNHTRLLWVFEGFTSYYDDLMLLRAGLIDEAKYFELLGRNMDHVMRGTGRHKQSVAESSFDAWTRYYKQDENSPNALVSYYTKGALLAMAIDLEIRHQSDQKHSLDDVMRLMWQRYGRGFYQGKSKGLAEDAMPQLILEATGVDLAGFIQRHAYGCDELPLNESLARAGIRVSSDPDSKTPDLDIRSRAEPAGLRLLTVYEGGAAHRAGLSAGDLLIAAGGLQVRDEKGLKNILARYRPGNRIRLHVFRRDELRQYTARLAPPASGPHRLQRQEAK